MTDPDAIDSEIRRERAHPAEALAALRAMYRDAVGTDAQVTAA